MKSLFILTALSFALTAKANPLTSVSTYSSDLGNATITFSTTSGGASTNLSDSKVSDALSGAVTGSAVLSRDIVVATLVFVKDTGTYVFTGPLSNDVSTSVKVSVKASGELSKLVASGALAVGKTVSLVAVYALEGTGDVLATAVVTPVVSSQESSKGDYGDSMKVIALFPVNVLKAAFQPGLQFKDIVSD